METHKTRKNSRIRRNNRRNRTNPESDKTSTPETPTDPETSFESPRYNLRTQQDSEPVRCRARILPVEALPSTSTKVESPEQVASTSTGLQSTTTNEPKFNVDSLEIGGVKKRQPTSQIPSSKSRKGKEVRPQTLIFKQDSQTSASDLSQLNVINDEKKSYTHQGSNKWAKIAPTQLGNEASHQELSKRVYLKTGNEVLTVKYNPRVSVTDDCLNRISALLVPHLDEEGIFKPETIEVCKKLCDQVQTVVSEHQEIVSAEKTEESNIEVEDVLPPLTEETVPSTTRAQRKSSKPKVLARTFAPITICVSNPSPDDGNQETGEACAQIKTGKKFSEKQKRLKQFLDDMSKNCNLNQDAKIELLTPTTYRTAWELIISKLTKSKINDVTIEVEEGYQANIFFEMELTNIKKIKSLNPVMFKLILTINQIIHKIVKKYANSSTYLEHFKEIVLKHTHDIDTLAIDIIWNIYVEVRDYAVLVSAQEIERTDTDLTKEFLSILPADIREYLSNFGATPTREFIINVLLKNLKLKDGTITKKTIQNYFLNKDSGT